MFLANPFGLLALLGIPAVVAIHFFQRTAKELPASTLFLLEHTRRQSPAGRRFERLSNSIPLWLQLLAVLLLAWLLAEPRFTKAGSVRRVAVVLDSSASMVTSRDAMLAELRKTMTAMERRGVTLELTALSSLPESPRLYSGTSSEDMITTLGREWQPRSGPLDPYASLRLARTIVSANGTVLYATDTPPTQEPPFAAKAISLASALENTGITGITFDTDGGTPVWKAMVKNFGTQPAKRTWQLVTAAGSSTAREIEIPPGRLITLQSAFPGQAENTRLVLSPDDFPLDDVLPMVLPKPKTIDVHPSAPPSFQTLFDRITRSIDGVTLSANAATPDLRLLAYDPLDPSLPSGNAVIFTKEDTRTGAWLKGGIVSASHPLVADLHWQSLLVRESVTLDPGPGDIILIRQEQRPLVFLRASADGTRQLVFNFDPTLSNLDQQPSFIVLLHRFVETLRATKIAPVAGNFETNQRVPVIAAPGPPLKTTATDSSGTGIPHAAQPAGGHTLASPGFLSVKQGDLTLLSAAFHFGDPRESDFTRCGPVPLDPAVTAASADANSIADPWRGLWLLLLIAALLCSWYFIQRGRDATHRAA